MDATSPYLNKPTRSLYDVVTDTTASWRLRRDAWLEMLARSPWDNSLVERESNG